MSEKNDDLADLLVDVLTDHCTAEVIEAAEGSWAADLWKVLEDLGLTSVGVPEDEGGAGGGLADAATVVRVAGRFAAPAPIAQTLMIAPALRRRFSLRHRPGPTAVGWSAVRATRDADGVRLVGTLSDVSYAAAAAQVLVLGTDTDTGEIVLADVPAEVIGWETRADLAGEPRGSADIDVRVETFGALPDEEADDVIERARDDEALALTWSMVGAMEKVQQLTVTYVKEREQFGRPIAKFQAVKQLAAQIAGLTAVSLAAANEATASYVRHGAAPFPVAAARSRTAAAATDVTRYAHQLHGAIGYTREYPLHQYSRRIWAWRDEGRSAVEWTDITGRRAVARGADQLWQTLTQE